MIWEQEVYTQFKYKKPRPYFHSFAADSCNAGLNFASEQEATYFSNIIQGKLNERQARRQEKRKQTQNSNLPAAPTMTGTSQMVRIDEKSSTSKKEKKKGKKTKLTKADIGLPSDFQHIAHVGWDPNKGFDMNNLDPNLKALFQKIGISENDLQDNATRSFIYDFIAKKGGMEAVKREVSVRTPSRPPARTPAPPIPTSSAPPPPPRGDISRPPAPPSRAAVPPPPPSKQPVSQPPPTPPSRAHSTAPPPPPSRAPPPPTPSSKPPGSIGGGPAPPPPPPPPSSGPPPPPPPPGPPSPPTEGASSGSSLPVVPDSRNALLSQIQNFKGPRALKHVDPAKSQSAGDERGDLLSEIRQGKKLHPVEPSDSPPAVEEPTDGLAGALLNALKQREMAIQGYDDSSDSDVDDDDDEDEWSD